MSYFRVEPVAVSEGSGFVDFVIRLDAALAVEARVNYGVDAGTATGNQDLRGQSGTLIFAPGETSKTVRVEILDGPVFEPAEVFWLDLSSPVNAVVAQRWTPALIFDNDGSTGIPGLRVSDVRVDESMRTASFFVWLDRPSTSAVSVGYSTLDGTAVSGQDYTATAGLLTFAAGEMVRTVTVNLVNDGVAENDEYFQLVLNSPTGASLAAGAGTALIGRNDGAPVGQPQVLARTVAVNESDALAQFVVQLSAPSTNEVRVNFGVDAGTAAGNTDFRGYAGTLVFAPGETLKTVPVPVIDNNTATEPTEVFWLDLNSPVNAIVPQRWTPALIFDNDAVSGTPAASVGDIVVDESGQRATLLVSLDGPSMTPVSIAWATADATARAGEDYRAASGTLRFEAGETVKSVDIDIVDDTLAEGTEYFRLVLGSPADATLADEVGRVTIARSDGPTLSQPYILAQSVAVGEGETLASLVVTLSAPSPNEVRVNFGVDAGTAAGNTDFRGYAGTLVFAPGETVKTIPVPLINDTASEPTEVFWLDLGSPVNAIVPQRWTPFLLVDNDGVSGTPAVSIGDAVVDETAQTAHLAVTLDRPSVSPVTVAWNTADHTAVAGSDYTAASGVLSFAPGETVKTVVVDLLDDVLPEDDEMFEVRLGPLGAATAADAVGAVVISRSDTPPFGQPQVLATPIVVAEGDTLASFVVQLGTASPNEVRVNFGIDAGTAAGNADFRGYAGTLVFAPGETVKTVPVPLIDDTLAEGTEIFNLDLTGAVNATIPQRFTSATLLDNDSGVAVFSHGIGNDHYVVTNALDRIAEGPRGGTDTVHASVSFILPDHVENLVLGGAATNGTGNGSDNVLRGTAGNNVLDGLGGIDTVVHAAPRAGATIAAITGGYTVSTAVDGTDVLLNVERLQFADIGVALDVRADQAAGQTVLLLGAVLPGQLVFDPSKRELLGSVIELFDFGYSLRDLSGAVLRLPVWDVLTGQAAPTHRDIAHYLLSNVNGIAPDQATLDAATHALDTEPFQGDWLWGLASSAANQSHVDLVGLLDTGLDFS